MSEAEELTQAIVHHFLTMLRYQHRFGHRLQQEFSISGKQAAVLRFLVNEGRQSVSAISRHLYVSDGTTSPLLDRMEQAGYVTRHRCAEDNRKVMIEPTERGRELIARAPMTMVSRMRDQLPCLPIAELRAIKAALGRLYEVVGRDLPPTDLEDKAE
ncbi:MAG: MarR family transcriptional regulator [Chloroflexota bacterium]